MFNIAYVAQIALRYIAEIKMTLLVENVYSNVTFIFHI